MDHEMLQVILDHCEMSVGGIQWKPIFGFMGAGFYLQLVYQEKDIITGKVEEQHTRKWYISNHATKTEVVQTLLKAALTSAEHIVREHFLYRGERVYMPHWDVDDLHRLITATKPDRRD